ncbi:MAG TPA: rhomboid family intramembrane serine protease [Woeseiaceae bacterium]|nr:rhomboid family intramembrane serine protease [Woeseiaceae bacterium]
MFDLSLPGASVVFAVTVAVSLLGMYRAPKIIDRCLFRPYAFIRNSQYDTIITSGFVHADLGHLIFNMVTFWFFAFPLERHLGTASFLAVYAMGLVLSHTCTWFKHKDDVHYASLGASGAISAVLFAYIVYFPTTSLFIFPFPIPIPAVLFAVGYVGYSYWASLQQRGRINHDAHLCGALSGLLFVGVTDPRAFAALSQMFT